MLEELKQKNLINNYCIWSLFFFNMAAKSLSCTSLESLYRATEISGDGRAILMLYIYLLVNF